MIDLGAIEELDNSVSFNFLVCKKDGRVAWTATPVSMECLYSEITYDYAHPSFEAPDQASLIQIPELETQSKPTDSDLFSTDEATFKSCLPRLSAAKAETTANKGTVRIYARSLRLNKFPLADESVHPSIITVERAALCQIFLETKYHKAFQQPSERDLRRQTLESLVCTGKELTPEQKNKFDEILKSVESEWSRLSRVKPSIDAFTIDRKLGSGGFGVVNMVTEKQSGNVYAMKDKTLRSGHEGRVLCERDLLKKASESGSRWVCKLHYAFQDAQALYKETLDVIDYRHLVLEYMEGGDFLVLLLQKAPLKEDEARFYLAEMINGIDACHKLGFMHRDVKPDNFLVSASGHLKIADFGLATSGEWIYRESYRSSRRKDLLRKYHRSTIGDGEGKQLESGTDLPSHNNEPILNHEKLKRMHADSVVGTYYYMAPEVLHGESYNATADWWSLGIILFECLFGYPPFWASTRRATQKIILDWQNTLEIPLEPRTSESAQSLIKALLSSANVRLRTPTWEIDLSVQQGHVVTALQRMQIFKKDVRNHWFFRSANLDFETMHLLKAPTLPRGQEASSMRDSPAKIEQMEKPVRTKDVMLHDERVMRERRFRAFKNYTYRGRDLDAVLKRFNEAIDNNKE